MVIRENAYTLEELSESMWLVEWRYDVLTICNQNFSRMSREEYRTWVERWKEIYKDGTSYIRDLKSSSSPNPFLDGGRSRMRKLMNTLLNARVVARREYTGRQVH